MKQASHTAPPMTHPLQALCERIEREAPWLHLVRCAERPRLSIEVRDSSNLHIPVSFSSEAEFGKCIQVVGKGASA